jgi:ribosomal-protein-alanine N-acetyltransferase
MNKTVPDLKTERLLLRDISVRDAESYELHFVDYEVIRYLSDRVPWPYPTEGIADFIRNQIMPNQGKNRWFWGICLIDDPGTVIGGIELWRPGTPENRGFWLGLDYWGKGYMTEAANAVTDFAFNGLGFEKLIFANAVGNKRSHRIKEKTRAVLVKTEPAQFVDPVFKEHEVWELNRDAWLQRRT